MIPFVRRRKIREDAWPTALRQNVFATDGTADLDPWFHKAHACDAIPFQKIIFLNRLGGYLFEPLFSFFFFIVILFFFLIFSSFLKKKVSSFLVFLSNVFYCWH